MPSAPLFWRRLCALPTFSFMKDDRGAIVRVRDIAGNWIERIPAQTIVDDAEHELANLRSVLRDAVAALTVHNSELKRLADSGDCGRWKAEEQPEYLQALAAIAKARAALGEA